MKKIMAAIGVMGILFLGIGTAYALRIALPTSITSSGSSGGSGAFISVTYEDGSVQGVNIDFTPDAPSYPGYRMDFKYNYGPAVTDLGNGEWVMTSEPPLESITITLTREDGTLERWNVDASVMEKILSAGSMDLLDLNKVLSEFCPYPPRPSPHWGFRRELRGLQNEYATLVQGIETEFDKQAKGIKTELDTLKAEKQEMIDAVKEAFQERKNGLETELSTLKTEQTEKLNGARTEFMDKLKAAIKEGRLGDIIGIIKEYLSKRVSIREQYNTKISELEKKLAGLNGEEQKAIGVIEAEYSAKITELEKKLAGFEGQKKTAIDALKKAAEEDIRALCEKYGVPYQDYYLYSIFGAPGWGQNTGGLRWVIREPLKGATVIELGEIPVPDPNAGAIAVPVVDENKDAGQTNGQEQKPIRFVPQMGGTGQDEKLRYYQ